MRQRPAALRRVVAVLAVVVVSVVFTYGFMVWNNNRDVGYPDKRELRNSYEKSIDWLIANQADILHDRNSMLWWMIRESYAISKDLRVKRLLDEYDKTRYELGENKSIWAYLFDKNCTAPIAGEDVDSLPDYNQLFVYGLTCSEVIGRSESVIRQQEENFCGAYHPLVQACATHQLMGARFMQRGNCGDPDKVNRLVAAVQKKIRRQMVWWPRVVDVYIQRVLMLADSGAVSQIKPVWISRILDHQAADGGWSYYTPSIPVWSGNYLYITHNGIWIRGHKGDFHTTAQAVLLLSLLLNSVYAS